MALSLQAWKEIFSNGVTFSPDKKLGYYIVKMGSPYVKMEFTGELSSWSCERSRHDMYFSGNLYVGEDKDFLIFNYNSKVYHIRKENVIQFF